MVDRDGALLEMIKNEESTRASKTWQGQSRHGVRFYSLELDTSMIDGGRWACSLDSTNYLFVGCVINLLWLRDVFGSGLVLG